MIRRSGSQKIKRAGCNPAAAGYQLGIRMIIGLRTLALAPFTPLPKFESSMFDALRATSAILVLIGHLYQIMVQPIADHPMVTRGFYVLAGYSVMIFFVISGYMIGLSIYRNMSRHAFERFDILTFARDRLLRLYPPLLLSVLICLAVAAFAKLLWSGNAEFGWMAQVQPSLAASLFFAQNMARGIFPPPNINFPLWSLSFEFWFYVIAALATSALVNRRLFAIAALVLMAFLILRFGLQEAFLPGLVVWLSGFASAFLRQNFGLQGRASRLCLACLTAFCGIVWLASVLRVFPISLEAKYAFGLFFSLVMLVALSYCETLLQRMSRLGAVNFVARAAPFSFTLYLIHYPLTHFLRGLLHPIISGNLALSIVAACCTFAIMMALAKAFAGFVEDKKAMEGLLVRPFR